MNPDTARSPLWLVAYEWVVGDDGRDIHVGEVLARDARLAEKNDDGDLQSVLAEIVDDATSRPVIYVWHPDDPAPPVSIRGRVVRIWALSAGEQGVVNPVGGLSQVSAATVAWGVELYVFEIDGELSPTGYSDT